MSQHRIANAVDSLIAHLVPADLNNNETTQERHAACFELVKSILNNPSSPAISSDVNHASDLIKRKLIQSNPSQALRFSNLYTRLLSLPVLDNKWAILYMLYQLSDSPDPNEPLPVSPALKRPAPPSQAQRGRDGWRRPGPGAEREQGARCSPSASRISEEDMSDAFQPAGLKKFPSDKSRRGPEEAKAAAAAAAKAEIVVEPTPKRDVSLRSTLLADNAMDLDPPETGLLRDLPFTLQGLSSTTLPFSKENSLKLPPTLPAPIISLLHSLAEPSLLYRGLDSFVNAPASTSGLLGQSLRAAITSELRSYLSLVATLEGQIRRALSSLDDRAPRAGIGRAGVTLKRCVVWTREATMGLRLLSLIAEESGSKKGGQLISLIHGFSTSHGDPTVGAFAERLLVHVTRPFYDILRHWIYDGELSDPYLEFFVKEQDPLAEKHREAKAKGLSSVWNDKYEVDDAMVPSIMSADFAKKVFLIGKSLNFIRHSCGDSQWVEAYSKDASKELRYGDTATLEAWIDEAYKTTMRRLMHLLTAKFYLREHLQAMKDYVLLGQGDFIALLMETLAPNLDQAAGSQYRHTLTAKLEEAIRGSNAQFASPEVLRRLDARMLQLSQGEVGWDSFTLEYKIDMPLDCILNEWSNRMYLKMFNFLFKVKRVEFCLGSAWRKCTTGSRGVLQTADPSVLQTWKSTRGTLAEMIHWVGQLQYYILFEVIEASWGQLQAALSREDATLDDLIGAHTTFLNTVTHKGLLSAHAHASRRRPHHHHHHPGDLSVGDAASATAGGSRPLEEDRGASSSSGSSSSPMNQIADLLRHCLNFRDCVDGLYSWAVSDFTSRQNGVLTSATTHPANINTTRPASALSGRQSSKPPTPIPTPTAQVPPGLDPEDADPFVVRSSSDPNPSELPALEERLRNLGAKFRSDLQRLLGDLAYQPEHETRFLGIAMNFNDVYQADLPRRHQHHHHRGGGGGGRGFGRATPATSGLGSGSAKGGGGGGGDGASEASAASRGFAKG